MGSLTTRNTNLSVQGILVLQLEGLWNSKHMIQCCQQYQNTKWNSYKHEITEIHSSTRDLNYSKTWRAAKRFTSSSARAWFKPQPCWKCRMFPCGRRSTILFCKPCAQGWGAALPLALHSRAALARTLHVPARGFLLPLGWEAAQAPPPCQSICDLLSAPEDTEGTQHSFCPSAEFAHTHNLIKHCHLSFMASVGQPTFNRR